MVRRLLSGVFVSVVGVVLSGAVYAQMVPGGCKGLTPSDWEWWARSCYLYPVIDFFTGLSAFNGFILR